MQAVLYVGHGSRVREGTEEAIRFIENSKKMINVPIQEVCFLELAKPSILEGITNCVARGAKEIAVVPILLLTAVHANEDIPFEIEKGKKLYPTIKFTYGKTFGVHSKIVDSLFDRVVEQSIDISNDAEVLIIGRGSSDPAVKRDLTKIAGLLSNKYPFKKVAVCFLYGASPSFPEALEKLKETTPKQVFIIPYLLFVGILLNGIKKEIAEFTNEEQQVILCESLGYHPNIQEVLLERVNELLETEEVELVI